MENDEITACRWCGGSFFGDYLSDHEKNCPRKPLPTKVKKKNEVFDIPEHPIFSHDYKKTAKQFSIDEIEKIVKNREWDESFIYFIFSTDEILYIGQTQQLHNRLRSHYEGLFAKKTDGILFSWIAVSREAAMSLEGFLILKHQPKINLIRRKFLVEQVVVENKKIKEALVLLRKRRFVI